MLQATFMSLEVTAVDLSRIHVRPVQAIEELEYQNLMQSYHYLGALPKIGETIWYIASYQEKWVALISFSSPAWKCNARDQWIGWDFRYQFDRLKLLTNNSRFLILPEWHIPNLGSKVLSLVQKRIVHDWQKNFGHPVLLVETFVDPRHFHGCVYKAANWTYVGNTKGYRRTRKGYTFQKYFPKMVFVKSLHRKAPQLLSQACLQSFHHAGGSKMRLSVQCMQDLPSFFKSIPDPRRSQGKRHRLPTVLAIAAGATLCGMRGYKQIAEWANSLGQKARQRFGCRMVDGRFVVPSEYVIRDTLIRVDPVKFDQSLQNWNESQGHKDSALALDGKTMRNSLDEEGYQAHILGVIGHETHNSYTQKK